MKSETCQTHFGRLLIYCSKRFVGHCNTPLLIACLAMVFISASTGPVSGTSAVEDTMLLNKLTPEEENVIINKGTEPPFSGKYYKHLADGTYLCKRCDRPLFRSGNKFDAGCGWPSFDDAISGAVKEQPDTDGNRTEIVCASCDAHLGHVFFGEGFTDNNTRHCVNSISLNFQPGDRTSSVSRAYFAGGCFWGTEFYLEKAKGVISARSGYMGGATKNPDYKSVCAGNSDHVETIEVLFDPELTTYETLARLFFEIHDPTQINQQGPDIGNQYRSAIFYLDDEQKQVAQKLISILTESGYKVVTQLSKADKFWPAENYHQDYYMKNGQLPYCHAYQKRF